MTAVLDRDHIWRAIDAHRARVADLLADLSPAEWDEPSLCAGWTVRDVAAHLTLQDVGPAGAIGMLFRWRGSMDRTIQHVARLRAAALTPAELVARIRRTIGSRRPNFGVSCRETLTDILVHSQDIALPLARRLEVPPDDAAMAATRVLSMRWPPPLRSARAVAAFRLSATDAAWSAGDGPHVRGPMAALLLVCCGRLVALPDLSGPGARDLAARLQGPRPPG